MIPQKFPCIHCWMVTEHATLMVWVWLGTLVTHHPRISCHSHLYSSPLKCQIFIKVRKKVRLKMGKKENKQTKERKNKSGLRHFHSDITNIFGTEIYQHIQNSWASYALLKSVLSARAFIWVDSYVLRVWVVCGWALLARKPWLFLLWGCSSMRGWWGQLLVVKC